MIVGKSWKETHIFPRRGFCSANFPTVAGQEGTLIAQCALSYNVLNEKVFIFLWFWFGLCLALQVYSCGLWFFRLMSKQQRKQFVVSFLVQKKSYYEQDDKEV